MSDRTFVNVVLRLVDFEENKEIFEHEMESPLGDGLIKLEYFDVHPSEVVIEEAMKDKMIPFDKSWGATGSYEHGSSHGRYLADGLYVIKRLSGTDKLFVHVDDVLEAYNNGDLLEMLQDVRERNSVLGWHEQLQILDRRE
jgi:hypothetical protein